MSEATESVAFVSPQREQAADRFGMWVFIASEALLFGALILVYLIARLRHPAAFADAAHELSFALGTINTAVLLTSSMTMALADSPAMQRSGNRARNLLFATALLGCVFLAIKSVEYAREIAEGHAPIFGLPFGFEGDDRLGATLFLDLYFAMTGLHALHLGAGILVVAATALFRPREPASRRRKTGGLALYWHFVDIVWVFLYPLLYLIAR
jgi:cytochrome c oxidase subunit 3